MDNNEEYKIFSDDGTDITPNISYKYEDERFETDDCSYKFSQKELISCNAFFENLHVHKSVENGDFLNPFINFSITDTETGEHFIIKEAHETAFKADKINMRFKLVGFVGFPKVFCGKKNAFLWSHFMDFVSVEFRKAAVIEEDPLDSVAESFVCKLCVLPQRSEEAFYSGAGAACGAVFEREGILCFNVGNTTITEIISENRLPTIPNKLSSKLNASKFKLRKTWQHKGLGPRIWSFPVEKLEPFGFTVNKVKKVNYGNNIISGMDEVFNHQQEPEKVECIDGVTGESRGEL